MRVESRPSGSVLAPVLATGLLLLLLSREFVGPDGPSSGVYDRIGGGFRVLDVLLIATLWFLVMASLAFNKPVAPAPARLLMPPLMIFGAALVISVLYGWNRGGTQLFFDWRNLVLGMAFALSLFMLCRSFGFRRTAVLLLAIVVTRSLVVLGLFLLGRGGVDLLGQAIPIYDGPALSSFAFASTVFLAFAINRPEGGPPRALFLGLGFLTALPVLLSFRRTYWGELAVAVAILSFASPGRRLRLFAFGILLVWTGTFFLGDAFELRVSSLNPFERQNPFAVTNESHVNDLRDAWVVIRQSPVLGEGLGSAYETPSLVGWKNESWGVHNALLHVWLRYGLLGLIAYVWFHAALFGILFRSARLASRALAFEKAWILGVASYLSGVFILGIGFSPWPYGSFQAAALISATVVIALACVSRILAQGAQGQD